MEIQNQNQEEDPSTKRREVASMLALAVAKANRARGFCEWLSCACQTLRSLEEAKVPLEAVEVLDGWQKPNSFESGEGRFAVRFYSETQEEGLKTFETMRQTFQALKARNFLEVEDGGNPNGLEPFFLLRAKHFDKDAQNTMKKAKISITIALDPATLEKLEKQAQKNLRTRANFASWIISEALSKPQERQGVKAMQKELEERANQETPAPVEA